MPRIHVYVRGPLGVDGEQIAGDTIISETDGAQVVGAMTAELTVNYPCFEFKKYRYDYVPYVLAHLQQGANLYGAANHDNREGFFRTWCAIEPSIIDNLFPDIGGGYGFKQLNGISLVAAEEAEGVVSDITVLPSESVKMDSVLNATTNVAQVVNQARAAAFSATTDGGFAQVSGKVSMIFYGDFHDSLTFKE